MASTGGGPIIRKKISQTEPPDIPVTATGANDPDIFCNRVEWKISSISSKMKEFPKGQSIWSPEFTAGGIRNLQIEFFPCGRESASLENFCSVFFWCPEGTNIKYELFVGSHRRAPDEDVYETRMGHGHSNFCLLASEVNKEDDSVIVGVDIIDVQKEISFGSGLRVIRPPMAKILSRYTSVVENRHIGRIEWKINKISERLKHLPKGASMYSPVFSAANIRDMLIEFYPNGNANTLKEGYCALYLRCPEGTQIIVTLIVGEVKKGPISAKFDGNAGKGLPEFCPINPQIDATNDTLLVAIEVKNPALSFEHISGGGKPHVMYL
jgi:hypothetical protein